MKNLYNFLTQCARRTLFLHKTTLLLLVALATSGNVWGVYINQQYTCTGYSYSIPSQTGYTWITLKGTSFDGNFTKDVSDNSAYNEKKSGLGSAPSSVNVTATMYAKPKDGYKFVGWYNNSSCTGDALSTDGTNNYKYETTVTAVKGNSNPARNFYAKFAPVTVSSVSNTTSSASPLDVKSPSTEYEATVTFIVSGADATNDFNYNVSGTGWAFKSWSYSNNTITIKVKYTATSSVSKGNHNGIVTLTSKGSSDGTSNGTYSSKSATVYAKVDFTSTLTYNDGSVDISVSDADKTTLNVSTLKTAYTGSDGKAGDGTITYALKSASSVASVTSAGEFYAKATGTYTIVASAARNSYYATSKEFTVTVGKRAPTIVWKNFEHIYSNNTLEDVASLTYNEKTVSGVGITYTSGNTNVMTVEGNKLHAQPLQTAQDVVITATTEETDYYKSVNTPTKTYHVEAAQTPVFKLNGQILAAQDTTIRLKIGETAQMAFDKIEESQFTYPTTPGAATYTHNSSNHTGVITAESYGNRTLVFEQRGTTTTFGQKHNVTVYVDKHPVTLETTTAFNNKSWLVDDIFEGDVYTVTPTPANGQPAQNDVTVTSSNEQVLKLVDGKWKAVAEGDAKLTIAQKYNDFWTGDTITTANIHVSKHTPTITWNNDLNSQRPWGAVINTPVSSSNTDIPFTLESSNTNIADYVDGKIEVYNVNGSVTFTLTQAGNDKWNAASANTTKTFTVYKPNNHVEFTLTNSNKSYIHHTASSNVEWNSSGYYRLGDGGISELETYAVIKLSGIPKTLTFDKSLEKKTVLFVSELPGTHICQVFESPDGTVGSWKEVWSHNVREENTNNQSANLAPSTQYIKFQYYGTVYCRYKNIKITERKEIVAPATYEFPSGGIGDNPTVRYIPVEWYNVRTCTVTISGTDAKYFKLGAHSDTIDSHVDKYNTSYIEVSYLHEEINKHTATLHIESEDGIKKDITLNGETTKAVQEIIWNENLLNEGRFLVANGESYGDVATASSDLPVQLTSGDPDKLTVLEDGSIKGLAEGSVQLYAYQAGDNKWAEARDTIYVDITNKTVQHIIWDDPLSNIQREEGQTITKPLTAHSDIIGVELPITYELDNDAKAFASINNGVLTINGWGTGKITAKQDGKGTYVPVSVTRTLMSYNPNPSCDPSTVLTKSSFEVKVTSSVTNQEFDLSDEPDTLYFTAKIGSGSLTVAQYYNETWHNLDTYTGSSADGNHKYKLNRNATKISFQSTIVIAFPSNHKISNLTVTQAKYLEVDNKDDLDFSTVQLGQTVKRSFTVNYSDISGVLEVGLQNPSDQFELQTLTLGSGCGSTKKADVVKINCTGKNKGEENNAIVIKNKKETLVVPIKATVTGLTQQIHWNHGGSEEIATTDTITFSATADSEMPVTFSSSDNSIAEVKNVNGQYVLDIKQGDTIVTITASQEGDDSWEPTSKSCKFAITKVTPTVTKDPTAQEVSLPATLADCALSEDFTASVPGSFDWKTPTTSIERFNNGYTAVFTPDNSGWYKTVERTIVVPVAKIPQTINWTVADADREIFCNANVTFNATAQYGTSVYFISSDEEIAYVDVNQVLHIFQGGTVKLTAKTDGDPTYAPAQKEYTFNIKRVSPEIVTYPVADTMKVSGLLSNATIRGGLVKLGDVTVDGSFSWVDGNNTPMNEAGTFTKEILFTPTEAGWYEPVTGKTLSVVVEKYAPVITDMNLTAADITYGTVLSGTTGLTGSIEAIDTVKKPNVAVQGSYAWVSKAELYDVHTTTATAVFKPANGSWYNDVEVEVPIRVKPAQASAYAATATLDYGLPLSYAQFVNATKGLQNEDVNGQIVWADTLDQTRIMGAGEYTFAIAFTPEEGSNYVGGNGWCTLTIAEAHVVEGDVIPSTDERVVVNSNITVTDDVTVAGLTVNAGKTITIANGGSLTVGDENSLFRGAYGNIIVESGGKFILGEGEVHLNDFTLQSTFEDKEPISGQVFNQHEMIVHGNAYFILDIDSTGSTSYGWYKFSVPFPVDELRGITRWENNEWKTLTNEVNYAVMKYHEDLRAQGKYGWKKYTGILQPGVGYSITTDSDINRYRFQMVDAAAFDTCKTYNLIASDQGLERDLGWNSLGNNTMEYVSLKNAPGHVVQIYDHKANAYHSEDATLCKFVVGAAYFVQATENNSKLRVESPESNQTMLRAPQRLTEENDECRVSLSLMANGKKADVLVVTCDDEAQSTYTRGKDVQKMDATKTTTARVWVNAKGTNLCAYNTAFSNNQAIIPLNISVPAEGEYTLKLNYFPAEDVYLRRNGVIIWNMQMGDYTADFAAGTDNSYELLVIRRAPNTATGVDEIDSENGNNGTIFVEKMIVDDQLFILREGILYDAQGRKVTNL